MNRKWYIFALVLLAALTGCRKEAVPDDVPVLPDEVPEMVVSVKADAAAPISNFTFLFWHDDDFNRGLLDANQGPAQPYHASKPSGNIGDYEETTGPTENESQDNDYNTGRVYPENYGIAICNGYGPCDQVSPLPTDTQTDYRTLTIKYPGVTDVVVSQNYLEGSSIFPFSGNLEFFHPQIQLMVRAKTASTMTKYIQNVAFSISKENLLSSLEWNVSEKKYLPSTERTSNGWTSEILDQQLNSSDEKQVGIVNVIPSEGLTMKSINLTISGEISNTVAGPYTPFTMTVPAAFKDDSDNELTLGLNDSYIILLIFDEDQIEITAVKVPWEEGGNVLVPIHPIPPETL